VAHFVAGDERQALMTIRELVGYLPSNNIDDPLVLPSDDPADREDAELDTLVPENPNKPYDIKDVIKHVVDHGKFLEVHKDWAPNIVVGFARMAGRSVGIVANQPNYLAGVLDINSSRKGGRFVRFCDAFTSPC